MVKGPTTIGITVFKIQMVFDFVPMLMVAKLVQLVVANAAEKTNSDSSFCKYPRLECSF